MNCFKCTKKLEPAFPGSEKFEDNGETAGGLVFTASGNYGSRVYDPVMSAPHLVIWICDECIVEQKDLVQMRSYATYQRDVLWQNFDPEEIVW